MAKRRWIGLALLGCGLPPLIPAACAEDVPAPSASLASQTIAGFRVTPRERAGRVDHRIVIDRNNPIDLMPGDRGVDMATTEYRAQRRREPGAAVDARMRMRIDGGLQEAPAFGMGGIGGALLRVTDALTGG